jgi:tetratricopeptide (TPR) repeat protein
MRVGVVFLFFVTVGLLEGCHHPEVLYREPERPPFEQGRTFEQKHRYAEAEQQYVQIDNIIVRDMALNQLSAAWDSVNANIIHSQETVNQQPRSAKARLRLAQDYYNKGLLCTRYTTGVVGDYPKDFVFGEQEFFYTEALHQANKALQLQNDYPEVHLLIGEIYLANFRRDDALKELKRLIGKNPDFARGYYAIGKVYFDMKEYEKLERYLIRTIKLDPELHDAYYLLGKFYLEKGWFDYAAFTFLESLRKNPKDRPAFDLLVDSCHELGKYYMEQEQYDQAIRLFREILQVESSYDVHQSLLLARQKKKEAIAKALEAAALEETTAETRADVSEFKSLLFAEQGLDVLLFTLDVEDDAEFREVIEYLKENNFQEAYDILQSAPDKNRANPYRSLALAFAQQRLGNVEESKQTLRQLAKRAEIESRIRLWAWKALRNMGEEPDVDTMYQVLGVIIEVHLPEEDGVDTLAAYSDGSARYINYSGKIIIWDREEGELADLARQVVRNAQTIVRDFPIGQPGLPIKANNIRINLLTPGGTRVSEDSATSVRQQTSVMSPIFSVGTDLLEAILAAYERE